MVCDTHTADALYSFKACQGTAPNSDDICKAMGHTASVYDIDDTPCSIIDGNICSKIQHQELVHSFIPVLLKGIVV